MPSNYFTILQFNSLVNKPFNSFAIYHFTLLLFYHFFLLLIQFFDPISTQTLVSHYPFLSFYVYVHRFAHLFTYLPINLCAPFFKLKEETKKPILTTKPKIWHEMNERSFFEKTVDIFFTVFLHFNDANITVINNSNKNNNNSTNGTSYTYVVH